MRRITILLLACVFALGGIGAAKADGIDIKVRGEWDFAFGWVNNKGFHESVNRTPNSGRTDNDNFVARQRVRTQINFITSEYLQAVLMFEIGDLDWGRPGTGRERGAGLDADGVNIEVRRAYLDWVIPNTPVSVRMGIQGIALPGTRMGNPIINNDVAGISVHSPITDWLSATAFWIRPFDMWRDADNQSARNNFSDAVDIFGIVLPVRMSGWSVSPYFLYGWVGANSGIYDYLYGTAVTNASVTADDSRTKVWWLGTNVTIDLIDSLTFGLDVIYGRMNRTEIGGLAGTSLGTLAPGDEGGTEGWFIGATLDYKLDFMTPGIFGWWASGDDRSDVLDDDMLGRLPTFGTDAGFKATSFGMKGYYGISNFDNSTTISRSGVGTWGIGIQLADITFIKDLKHTLRVAYYRGTNDSELVEELGGFAPLKYRFDPVYLTDRDHVWEVNFDHQYKIYENLTAVLELGYLHLSSDRETWGDRNGLSEGDDAWKAEILFQYAF